MPQHANGMCQGGGTVSLQATRSPLPQGPAAAQVLVSSSSRGRNATRSGGSGGSSAPHLARALRRRQGARPGGAREWWLRARWCLLTVRCVRRGAARWASRSTPLGQGRCRLAHGKGGKCGGQTPCRTSRCCAAVLSCLLLGARPGCHASPTHHDRLCPPRTRQRRRGRLAKAVRWRHGQHCRRAKPVCGCHGDGALHGAPADRPRRVARTALHSAAH